MSSTGKRALEFAGYGVGCLLVGTAFGAGLLSMGLTFFYLLDKGWGVLLALILTLSVIGSLIAAIYAAFWDGYWWPLVLGVLSSVIMSLGGGGSERRY